MLEIPAVTTSPSSLASFVEIRIAPSLPREPYKAAAAVPFNTLILSIFSGETSNKSDSTGIPSTTISGVLPRREKLGAWNMPVGLLTVRPATCPESALPTLTVPGCSKASVLTCWVVYPSFFFCCLIPMAVTTTSSISFTSSDISTLITFRLPIGRSTVSYPTKEKTSVPFFGASIS